jgi:dTMP kinase
VTGKFITLEGLDGCGKTTQLRFIEEWLEKRDVKFVSTFEPGGTDFGKTIRRVLLDSRNSGLMPQAELFLFAADRAQHVEEFIKPRLARGEIVLSDRYTDATLAFQGYGRGFDIEMCKRINQLATGGLVPGLTLLFDITVEDALARISERKRASDVDKPAHDESRLDNEHAEFHGRVRAGYLEIAAGEPDRFKIIDASCDVEQTWTATRKALEEFFAEENR